ncbi:MAG TPA: PadR family transcriptional regulator [Segeticoccus sp.]|jgi:DNA-binding PadR family transcriptional regulator|nr:PadR family transcriptional regulator [Segeticoccus sp.]
MSRRRVSNNLALAVLACLAERPMHPYEISQTLRFRGKEQSIKLNYGSLYSVVESLKKHGLIEARETVREGRRPERTVYGITDAGAAEFEDWLAELLSTPTREYTSLEAALSLIAGLAPRQAAQLLDLRARHLELEVRQIDAAVEASREGDLPEIFLIETLFREHMLRAELEFVRKLVADIRSESLPGTPTWRRMHELREAGTPLEQILSDPVRYLGEEARPLAPDADQHDYPGTTGT